ncbi:hypothetical protein C7378_1692 [Acidipila rosea]|uniref:Uncharacterized protein n=1 Tax=Acidipila rosea TaxID=768535 RepID=A0A4R1L784_9BACT|nr:hypothetical protein C7378_1692 [Acidipila rosea]
MKFERLYFVFDGAKRQVIDYRCKNSKKYERCLRSCYAHFDKVIV